jgi:hypothetical protein
MVEQEISKLQLTKICLITNQLGVFVLQKFSPADPGEIATSTFFKSFDICTELLHELRNYLYF